MSAESLRDERVRAAFAEAFSHQRSHRTRHEVTADRLRETLRDFYAHTDGEQRDDISRLIDWLEQLPAKP